jgi:hypothetical protein
MRFITVYEQHYEHSGKECSVIRELTDSERDPEVGTMFRIKLETGEEIDCWPEELDD